VLVIIFAGASPPRVGPSRAGATSNPGGQMTKAVFAVLLAAGLMAAPLPNLMQRAAAQTTQPASAEKKQTKTTKPPTAGQVAARERMKKCGAEWQAAKAAGKTEKGMKWPQYWSACNKRLKAAGG
jgi:hypothetical protein